MTSHPTAAGPEPEVATDEAQRRMILAAMCIALVAVVASVSGLNVAQQVLAVDLGASQGDVLWIINSYTVALAALLLPIGAIGDRWGRKPVLIVGMVLFLIATGGAALANSVTSLLVLRVLGGVAAAMIMPATLSIITSTFPGDERDKAIGVWAGFAGAGGLLGLVVSAVVVDNFTWPWVFAAPILACAVAFALTLRYVPNSREHADGRFDVVGSVLSAVAIGAIVLGIHEGPEAGWSAPLTVAGLGLGIAGAVAFVIWELRQPHPLFDLRLFRNRTLAAGSLGLFGMFAIMGALFLVLIQYVQAVLGYSAVHSAISLLPMAFVMMPLSAVAPLIARRIGMRSTLGLGALILSVGAAMLGVMSSVDGGYFSVLPGLLVAGVGVGLAMTPGTTAITGSLPIEDQGVASALNDTVREVGTAFGVALIGSILSATYSSSVATATGGLPEEAADVVNEGIGGAVYVAELMGPQGRDLLDAARGAFVDGWAVSMWLSAGIALVIAAVVFFVMPAEVRTAEAAGAAGAGAADDPAAVRAAVDGSLPGTGSVIDARVGERSTSVGRGAPDDDPRPEPDVYAGL